jgi:hypothetical protein
MIDYSEIGRETWLESSFLKKNKRLLMMFYLWMEANSILDFKFKFIHFLDLLTDISKEDVLQIQKDWEYIVAKIKRGDAHLLSEGDTYYLGACTKAANNKVTRVQFVKDRPDAKPRAFSLKQQYLNYLIQTKLLKKNITTESIFKKVRRVETIEDAVKGIFTPFLGTTDKEILKKLGLNLNKGAKGYKRSIVNRIFGVNSGRIEELEKANITLKVLTLESTGTLKESVAFRAFKFKELVNEVWYDEIEEEMADFHFQLESRKFLFVVFQKQKNSQDIVLMKTMFWNFPIVDMPKAEEVWKKTINLINEGQIIKEVRIMKNGKERVLTHFPGLVFNGVAHVRPHAQIAADTELLPIPDQHTGRKEMTKQCFWLNAKYVERAIQGHNE